MPLSSSCPFQEVAAPVAYLAPLPAKNFVILTSFAKMACCKYCKRTRNDPNPWLPPDLRETSDKPNLIFRRDRGRECSSCLGMFRCFNKPQYQNTAILEDKLNNDPDVKKEFDADLEIFEEKKRKEALTRAYKGYQNLSQAYRRSAG